MAPYVISLQKLDSYLATTYIGIAYLQLGGEQFKSSGIIFFESYTLALVYGASNSVLNDDFEISNKLLLWIFSFFNFETSNHSFISIVVLLFFIFFKNLFLIFVIIFRNNFFFNINADISKRIYDKFMMQNYEFFVQKNSSQLVSNIIQDVGVAMRGFEAIFNILIEILLISATHYA